MTTAARSTLRRLLHLLGGIALAIGIGASALCAIASQTVFFYNPESNVDNFATLKSEFDDYLAGRGGYTFQPFSDRSTFERTLQAKPNGLYLLSSWHYSQLSARFPMEPVLVGTYKGEYLQSKVLTARDIGSVTGLQGATIAGAGTEDYLRNLLRQMLGPERESLAGSIKVLTVPKDIDALMAVGFGMAKAAISSESSLQKLGMINARQRDQLKILATSEKSFLLVAAIPKQSAEQEASLIKTIETMGTQPSGERNLRLLGLDGWKRFDTLDASVSRTLK